MRAIPDFEKALAHKCRLNILPGAIPSLSICRSAAARPRCPYALQCIDALPVCGQPVKTAVLPATSR